MLCKNRLRVFVAFIVVSTLAVTFAMLIAYNYVTKLRADNKELYEALVISERVVRDRVTGCKILLSDPVVKRIMKAK